MELGVSCLELEVSCLELEVSCLELGVSCLELGVSCLELGVLPLKAQILAMSPSHLIPFHFKVDTNRPHSCRGQGAGEKRMMCITHEREMV